MEKKIKRLVALFAACALAFLLPGCDSSSGSGDATASVELKMVYVPGGKVTGAKHPDVEDNAFNWYKGVFIGGRTVTLGSFWMSNCEVTQAEYASVMANQKVTVGNTEHTLNANPSSCTGSSSTYKIAPGETQGRRPVEGVTWFDAVYYCNLLSKRDNYDEVYEITVSEVKDGNITKATVTMDMTKNGYRLPTEAEWEYAARGGDPSAVAWNYLFSGAPTASGVAYDAQQNSGLDAVGWYKYNTCNSNGETGDTEAKSGTAGYGTHEVGKKKANALGLYDMSGNVWEWCWDWNGTIDQNTDPTGASSGSNRVRRGGSWIDSAFYASVCRRVDISPSYRLISLGFRVVRSAN